MNNFKNWYTAVALATATLTWHDSTFADPITSFTITGEIDSAVDPLFIYNFPLPPPPVAYTATASYDLMAARTLIGPGQWQFPLTELSLEIGATQTFSASTDLKMILIQGLDNLSLSGIVPPLDNLRLSFDLPEGFFNVFPFETAPLLTDIFPHAIAPFAEHMRFEFFPVPALSSASGPIQSVIPEPSSVVLGCIGGLCCLLGYERKKRTSIFGERAT